MNAVLYNKLLLYTSVFQDQDQDTIYNLIDEIVEK